MLVSDGALMESIDCLSCFGAELDVNAMKKQDLLKLQFSLSGSCRYV